LNSEITFNKKKIFAKIGQVAMSMSTCLHLLAFELPFDGKKERLTNQKTNQSIHSVLFAQ